MNDRPSEKRKPVDPPGDIGVKATYKDYFLQYASYVITDRAIPDLADGLKPVQRRVLYSLWENEDGRFNKVANIVGHCMKYHPHGDASIYSALVSLGQKDLLVDTQGNWGNPVTNDAAAAARYIEARLTPFAREVLFAPQLTAYQQSYDGRNLEPVTLPVRFPLLLAMGAEGIAVGLTTRILPHNFIELLEAQKSFFRGEDFQLFPDFPTGGLVDVSAYNDGRQGSRVKVRARIKAGSGKSVTITEVPYGITTETLIDSILAASEKGKIKVAHIEDNSAAQIEIVVTFQRGVDMDKAIDALYAFTGCEITLPSNCMVIQDGRPSALSVVYLLTESARQTRNLLKLDLQIQQENLEREWHLKSLVQIFIENRIYLEIERCETWESVLETIDTGLGPFKPGLRREVARDDLIFLTEVKIRRISAWDSERARQELQAIDEKLEEVKKNLRHLTPFTIDYLDHLIRTYGAGKVRRSEIASFDAVKAVSVVERTERLYVDRKAGFIGTDSKIGDETGPCSSLDDVLVILRDGGLIVSKVGIRKYIGDDIIHVQVFHPQDRDIIFNMICEDGRTGRSYVKRFTVGGITRDKRYELGSGEKNCRTWFLSVGSESFCHVRLRKKPRIRTDLYVSFDDQPVKGRAARGVIITKHKVSSVRAISSRVYTDRVALIQESSPDDSGDDPEAESEPTTDRRKAPAPAAQDESEVLDGESSQRRLFE